jgi:DNA-binding CsgD family transcriptional regulator
MKHVDPDQFRELYEKGYNDREIADELGISQNVVSAFRRKLGLPSRFGIWFDVEKCKELYYEGKTDRQIARELGLNDKHIFTWRERYRLPENKHRKIQVREKPVLANHT